MAISQAVCNVFKQELLKGNHDFDGGAAYYIALYTSSATMGATTLKYVTTNEITNASGSAYTAGGKVCGSPSVTGGQNSTTAFVDFDDVSFTDATFTAKFAQIYRSDGSAPTNDSVLMLDFGGDFTATSGTFTIQFPSAGTSTAILRLA